MIAPTLKSMIKGVFRKIFGDRGYISQKLLANGIQLITKLKKNIKNKLMPFMDKILLLKRALIETVFGKLKLLNKFQHSRHRSTHNAFIHIIAALSIIS